jgi:glycosyltransferase involved in cell wall biosynthesis
VQKTHSLTIAIPAYNEAGSIEHVVGAALAAAKRLARSWEILVVNDGSTDQTATILARLARKHRSLRIITHPTNQGFSGAIKSCYTQATKDLIFLLPADGQVKAADCARFLKHIAHADVVVGYRANNPEPLSRRINSWVFHTLYRALFGVNLREISTSILWKKRILDAIRITAIPRSALIEPEVVYKAWASGARFAQVAIPYYPRHSGTPKGSSPLMIILTIRELFRLWMQTR